MKNQSKTISEQEITIDITDTVLETDRLILRGWRQSDLNDLFEYASVKGVGEPAGWKPHESVEESQKVLDGFIKQRDVFAIQLKSNNKVIGSVGIHGSGWAEKDAEYSKLKLKEIGYVLSKDYWGQGIMPEAVKAVINYYFKNYGFDAVSCCFFAQNAQSQRVIEKCGFTFLKIGKYFCDFSQKEFDDNIYIMHRRDFNP